MRLRSVVGALVLGLAGAVIPAPCRASHHLWTLTQVFSNASGSVQFIQLQNNTTDTGETAMSGVTITTSNGHTFTFGSNLTGNSANGWLLVATSNFGSLPNGVTPDYIIPAGFFPTGGGTLNYGSSTDTWSYGTVPTDGVHSLVRSGATQTNLATNFAGKSGSVNVSTPVPAVPRWGIALLLAGILLASSGLLRSRSHARTLGAAGR